MEGVPNETIALVARTGRRAGPSAYSLDMWREARRHWMAAGVLAALALAVLCPRLGAPGGALHTEFSASVPLCYVYYCAGRRRGAGAVAGAVRSHARLLAASVAHAHLVAPALCAALVYALRDALDQGVVKGVLLWSRGGGCAWLSLALSDHSAAPAAAALVWLAALPAAPLATALLCERGALPSPWSVLLTLGTAAAPFAAGLWRGAAPGAPGGAGVRLCALALLYAELCASLQSAAGVLRAADVLAPLLLALLALGALAGGAALWERAGVLAPGAARVLALCALPRAPDPRWEAAGCAAGLARLPGVFLAPAQALLLAALAPDDAPPTAAARRPLGAGSLS